MAMGGGDCIEQGETIIGTYNGRPLYRNIKIGSTGDRNAYNAVITGLDILELVRLDGTIQIANGTRLGLSYTDGGANAFIGLSGRSIWARSTIASCDNRPVLVIAEYTKTTDT